jgi:hypothetical protein
MWADKIRHKRDISILCEQEFSSLNTEAAGFTETSVDI